MAETAEQQTLERFLGGPIAEAMIKKGGQSVTFPETRRRLMCSHAELLGWHQGPGAWLGGAWRPEEAGGFEGRGPSPLERDRTHVF